MDNFNAEELQKALAKADLHEVDGCPFAVVPPGFEVQSLEHMLIAPRVTQARITACEVGGLVTYVNRFKDSRTALYSGPRDQPKIEARIDDNQPGVSSRVFHKVEFNCPRTVEWITWNRNSGTKMGQIEFAEFIENNIKDVVEPAGADLLTAALKFQDTGSVEFRSAVRLEDGRIQFGYVQKDQEQGAKFPSRIKIAIPIFEGVKMRYPVEARVRYRIKEGELTIWYELDRPDLVMRAAYDDLLEMVEKETEIHVHRAI